jgi:hypothetical protein
MDIYVPRNLTMIGVAAALGVSGSTLRVYLKNPEKMRVEQYNKLMAMGLRFPPRYETCITCQGTGWMELV